MTARCSAKILLVAALATAFACASEVQDDPAAEDSSTSGASHGGTSNVPSKLPTAGTSVVQPTAGAASKPSGGATSTAGKATGGHAGNNAAGNSAGAGGANNVGSGGASAGGPNQPTQCDEATAVALDTMSTNVKVAGNACLKMTLPAEQTWIKKVTLQPDSGTYPLAFTWSNCGTNSNGVLTANYANATLTPITAMCPIFLQLTGTAAPLNLQWWGG